MFFSPPPREMQIKQKQMGPNQSYRLFHIKGNHKQNKKTTHRMGEKFANNATDKELYLSSKYIIQTAYAAQYQKNQQPYQKWAEDLNRHFLKKKKKYS